jgi:cell division septation protein DedD
MADDRSRGVHLTDKQLVFVFMAATVAAVVVFLCGVLVGRGVQAARGPVPDATMVTPTQVIADGAGAEGAAPAPAPAGKTAAGRGASETGDLPFSAHLDKSPPPEQLKTPPAAAPPAVEPPGPPEAAEEAAPQEADAGSGEFTVQVAAVKKKSEADAVIRRLKTHGFDAYVFTPDGNDKLGVLRVRVGHFKTRPEAEALARRIEREDKSKPWVTRTR